MTAGHAEKGMGHEPAGLSRVARRRLAGAVKGLRQAWSAEDVATLGMAARRADKAEAYVGNKWEGPPLGAVLRVDKFDDGRCVRSLALGLFSDQPCPTGTRLFLGAV